MVIGVLLAGCAGPTTDVHVSLTLTDPLVAALTDGRTGGSDQPGPRQLSFGGGEIFAVVCPGMGAQTYEVTLTSDTCRQFDDRLTLGARYQDHCGEPEDATRFGVFWTEFADLGPVYDEPPARPCDGYLEVFHEFVVGVDDASFFP